jgi:hypothetical protein
LAVFYGIRRLHATPCNKALLEKLIVALLVKKFPAFNTARKFITVFKGSHY